MHNRRIILSYFISLFCLLPISAFARAGGGSSGKNGLFTIIGFICIAAYRVLLSYFASSKQVRLLPLLDKISKNNNEFDYGFLRERTKKCFFKVQKSWRDGKPEISKQFVSKLFNNKHKLICQKMFQAKEHNVMKKIKLIDIKIVAFHNFQNQKNSAYWAYIKGSMIDYTISDLSGIVKKGNKRNAKFIELWHFTRENNAWVLNEIKNDVSICNIIDMHSFSE